MSKVTTATMGRPKLMQRPMKCSFDIDEETKKILVDEAWSTRKTFAQVIRDVLEVYVSKRKKR